MCVNVFLLLLMCQPGVESRIEGFVSACVCVCERACEANNS